MSATTKKSGIKGKVRQQTEDFGKKIGIVEVEVLCINPTEEEYSELLGIELKEDSKFKKPRKYDKSYCEKTPCGSMGFSQKASCRPYKNCYK